MFNQLQNEISKYFGISRTETRGIIVLILASICIILSPLAYHHLFRSGYTSYVSDSLKLDSCLQILHRKADSLEAISNDQLQDRDTLFVFNPNEISYQQMILLGFDTVLAHRILKYRANKGRFFIKKDLLKIYGLPESLYSRLVDYISLPDSNVKIKLGQKNMVYKENNDRKDTLIKQTLVNINFADTSDLKRINGIGSVLSMRIIKYRDLLGGYSNIHQLDDVYGLKGKSLENIKAIVYVDSLFVPEKIRINFSEWEELVRHPYISSNLANDIIKLRSVKGFLNNADDLKNIPYLNDSILHRLLPYLEF
jgi:competence ComEA-like helix-hairpin-helix protein